MPEAKPQNIERRMIPIEEMKIVREMGKPPRIEGYAAVFDSLSVDFGGWRERIAKGAFADALKKKPDVRGVFNHDANFVLARTKSGTLELKEDKRGLWMRMTPPNTQLINDMVIAPMERGDIDQMSFAFDMTDGEESYDDKERVRTLNRIGNLYDVSVVTYPAYPDTTVALRNIEAAKAAANPEPVAPPAEAPKPERKFGIDVNDVLRQRVNKLYEELHPKK